jgi:hypothetical protein
MKYQNVVFLPYSADLRQDLHKLGLDFLLVKIENKSHLMVITNQLRLIVELSNKHKLSKFYVSDSHRQVFSADVNYYKEEDGQQFYATKPQRLGIITLWNKCGSALKGIIEYENKIHF